MRRIQDKVEIRMKKDFKVYDLIKEVEEVLAKREKREQEFLGGWEVGREGRRGLVSGESAYGWARYGGVQN